MSDDGPQRATLTNPAQMGVTTSREYPLADFAATKLQKAECWAAESLSCGPRRVSTATW